LVGLGGALTGEGKFLRAGGGEEGQGDGGLGADDLGLFGVLAGDGDRRGDLLVNLIPVLTDGLNDGGIRRGVRLLR
jgi:hypothetical protein